MQGHHYISRHPEHGSDRSGRYPAVTPNESLSERAQPPRTVH
eukprot:COSAG03_NODE_11684_length_580_cov_2058.740125_1_plen_41_part_10